MKISDPWGTLEDTVIIVLMLSYKLFLIIHYF